MIAIFGFWVTPGSDQALLLASYSGITLDRLGEPYVWGGGGMNMGWLCTRQISFLLYSCSSPENNEFYYIS